MVPQYSSKLEEVKVWLDAIDHIQVTSPSEVEDAMLFFYGTVLGLTEIAKPEALKNNGGAWYALGDIQIHISRENNSHNEASRRHICFRVHNLDAFEEHLKAHGVEIIGDRQLIPGYNRFYIRDPGGNRLEIASVQQL
ncbi:bleomycin resistance protein [Nostoc sp. RF31YmG]|jgi:catechol 2,3-dioxygenase-like lactoylglutathione lyase family enzyme|nr:bleomycin resistance protein [Nostoc sp. RF31YmG]